MTVARASLLRLQTLALPARGVVEAARELLPRLARLAPDLGRHALVTVAALEPLAGQSSPWIEIDRYPLAPPAQPLPPEPVSRRSERRAKAPAPSPTPVDVARALARAAGPMPLEPRQGPAPNERLVAPRGPSAACALPALPLPDRSTARRELAARAARAGASRAWHSIWSVAETDRAPRRASEHAAPATASGGAASAHARPMPPAEPEAIRREPAPFTSVAPPRAARTRALDRSSDRMPEPVSAPFEMRARTHSPRAWDVLLDDAIDRATRRGPGARAAARDGERAASRAGSPPLVSRKAVSALDSPAASDERADRSAAAAAPKEIAGTSGLARLAQRFRTSEQAPERPAAELRVLRAPAEHGLERREAGELGVHAEPLQPVSGGGAASLWEFETQLAAVLRRQLRQAGLMPPDREP